MYATRDGATYDERLGVYTNASKCVLIARLAGLLPLDGGDFIRIIPIRVASRYIAQSTMAIGYGTKVREAINFIAMRGLGSTQRGRRYDHVMGRYILVTANGYFVI